MPDVSEQSDASDAASQPRRASIGFAGRAGGRPAGFGRVGERARSWARRALARDRILGSLRTLLWVGPLTLLIWVYAEREQTASVANVKVGVDVNSTDPGTLVTLAPDAKPWVTVTLIGPRAQLEAVRERVEFGGANRPISVPVNPGGRRTGRQALPAGQIANDPRFVTGGVTVASPDPATIDVVVDPVVERDVKVAAEPEFLRNTLGTPTFDPPTVRVRGPERVLDEAAAAGKLAAYAGLVERPELRAAATDQTSVTLKDVKVYLPLENKNVTIVGRPTLTAVVALARPEEMVFNFIPVEMVAPPVLTDDFKVTDYRPPKDVVVVGSREKIDELREYLKEPNAVQPTAQFKIPPDTKEGTHRAPLVYDFGKFNGQVRVKKGAAPDQIDYTLTPRGRDGT